MAKATLDKKILSEVNWILYASEYVHKFWRQMCDGWLAGELPDAQGDVTGVQKDAKTPTVANFGCFEGTLSSDEIMNILVKVDKGETLLKKDVS